MMNKFLNDLIDNNDPKCAKTLCGIIGFFTICLIAVMKHDPVTIGILATLIGACFGLTTLEKRNKVQLENNSNDEAS